MSDACKHPNWRLSAGLWSSATPVPWTCPDCGGRGTVQIVDTPDQDEPTAQLSDLESQLSAISSELLALSSQLFTLGHRLRALGSQP